MIARLTNPAIVSVLAVLLGTATGLGWFWRAANVMVAAAIAAAPKEVVTAPGKEKGWDFWTVEIDNLAAELKDEKAKLRQQSEQVEVRAARLAAEQQELAKVRAELEAMRHDIDERTIAIGADEAKNLRSLSQTYGNLSPRAAVTIIKEMDDVTVVKILSLMKADVVAPIFEEMSKSGGADGPLVARRAAILSEKLRLVRAIKTATTN